MTEEEAMKRWCPFASSRVLTWHKSKTDTQNYIAVGPTIDVPSTACLASGCMAWRWEEAVTRGTGPDGSQIVLVGTHKASENWKYESLPTPGHCGLAGTP